MLLSNKGVFMSSVSSLKLITAKRTNNTPPVLHRRNKLSKRIFEQIELVKAMSIGKHFTNKRFRSIKNADGVRKSVEVETTVRQWWWVQENGKFALSIRYGTKVIPLSPKSNAIECADYAELTSALSTIKQAVDVGELDLQIEAACTKLRDGFRK
jgi:hypothetical protein